MERLAIPTRGETSRIPSGQALASLAAVGAAAFALHAQPEAAASAPDIVIGVVSAFVGNWLLPQLGIDFGAGLVAAIINATIGALILLFFISRALRRL